MALDEPDDSATLIVVGDEDLLGGDFLRQDGPLGEATRTAAEAGLVTVLSETGLWERLGLIEEDRDVRRLYTPAMLADLIGVSVAVVRRWHRRGLIVPAREVRRLPYFDFQEVATARRLAELLAAGCSPEVIERKLADLARFLPGVERPLAQLGVIVEGRQLLLRQDGGLVEPGGQLRLDFECGDVEQSANHAAAHEPGGAANLDVRHLVGPEPAFGESPDQLMARAIDLEDEGLLEAAAEMYRAVLMAGGPKADVNFLLAELLYRLGDLSAARERYSVAVELDEDYVEARANLGCLLAETGQLELAAAAFRGALGLHADFPDAHYHLARTLDELGQGDEAEAHWSQFLSLVPNSPWADEARLRLQLES